jgi:acyl-CoA thioesterase-2
MESSLPDLIALLDVEELEKNYFRGYSPTERWGRIFGGQVLGQALMAAGRTVSADRRVHSLQSYFLLGGDPEVPIMFEVDRIRDGRSFTTRRVRAFQHGEAIFALSASFHVDEDGPEHQIPMPDAPDPDSEQFTDERPGPRGRPRWQGPLDLRWFVGEGQTGQMLWMRADTLPDDPLLHACVLAYASDFGLVSSIAQPHSDEPWPTKFMMASLDHTIWFHRAFRVDQWLLYTRHSPAAQGARGLALGSIYTEDGTLVASVAQEGLIRPVRER